MSYSATIGGRGSGGFLGHHAGEYDEENFAPIDPRVLRRFFAYVMPYRARLSASLIAVALFTLTQILLPLTIRSAVDTAVGRSSQPLGSVLGFFMAIVALNAGFNFVQEWVTARLAQRIIFDLRRAMFAHLQRVSLSFIDQTQVGRLMSRLQGDVNALQEFVEQSVSAIGDFFLLLGIVAVLLSMNWWLGLLTLSVLPVLVAIRAAWLPWARQKFWRARNASSAVNAALAENINGIRTVQENRREEANFARYKVKAIENLRAQIGSALASQLMVPTVDVLTGLAMVIVVLIGSNAVLSGTLGVGSMVAFIFYVQRFFDPIRTLSMQYTVLQRAVSAGHRIFEVLDVPVTIQDEPDAVVLNDILPSIEFRHVTYGFRPGQPILKDINLRIEPYETVALVGATGSGKTTITALIRRFYDVWDGAVLVGGHDVRRVALGSLGHSIAMVLQEPFLFTGTILDNIRYHVAAATRDDVVAAAKAVRAHEFIVRMSDGYDTVLHQRGRNLSIGQRQLISFARALVANPRILILDEATANIDSFTEQAIQRALRVLLKDRTSIVIAHRLATIRHADRIVVLHGGCIAEQGTHDELLQRPGLYRQLHDSAAGSFDDLP